jgi:photosystem II stability/assembly factor-like uncharacterized protein
MRVGAALLAASLACAACAARGNGAIGPVTPCPALPPAGQWQNISPPGVGSTDALTLDPFDSATVWLGTDQHGLYKSSDCGATWSHVSSGQNQMGIDSGAVWSMAIDPVDKGTVYAVSGYGGAGLWKSRDGGVDWAQLFPPDSEFAKTVEYNFVGNVSMDPNDHLHLVVGTHGNCAPPYDPTCQAESKDGGATWHIVRVPGKMWAEQAGPYVLNASSWLFAVLFDGLYLTTDNGASFTQVAPPGVVGTSGGEFTHRPFVAAPDGTYYLPTINSGILRSSDGGKSWSVIPRSGTGYQLGFAMGKERLYSGDANNRTYQSAPLPGGTEWSALTAPPLPEIMNEITGAIYLEYDDAHHLLYSSNFGGGAWRMVTP